MTIAAETFVDAATQLCMAAAGLGAETAVLLHRASGPAGLMVDTFAGVTEDGRRWMLTDDAWRTNPTMIELRDRLGILGPERFEPHYTLVRQKGYVDVDEHEHLGVPLLGRDGWFGTIGFASRGAKSAAVERQLLVLVTELSVWCTARGISTLPDVRPLAPRQHEVATLAARGRTNAEIAGALGISINTVKLRLKQAFERLGVESRTELVSMLQRLAPLDGIPEGITHRDTVTITRAAMPSPALSDTSLGVAR
jgi:DNA-binding CsgD family transcriptional regulator